MESARSGENVFPTHLAETRPQILQELDVQVGPGSEFGMAAFGSDRKMAVAVPEKPRLAQARAGGDDRRVANRVLVARIENDEILGHQPGDAVGVGFDVIDEPDLFEVQCAGEVLRIDDPGEVRHLRPALFHRPGNAEAGMLGFDAMFGDEAEGHLLQACILVAGISAEVFRSEAEILRVEGCQVDFCAADISSQNHQAF